MPGLFITGTDTGVGKTYVTALLAQTQIDQGVDVGIMKPISCGPDNDANFFIKTFNLKDDPGLINPVSLSKPLAPSVAARLEKRDINIARIIASYRKLAKAHKLMLVEGVGGVLVPIADNYFVADLIKELRIPAIIVARAGLGTINHTLLTVEALKKRKVPVKGIIMNGYSGKDLAEKTNDEVIQQLTGVPILSKIPWKKR